MRIKKPQRGENIAHIIHVVEPPNNGHVGDECFVHYSEFVPSSDAYSYWQGAHSLSIVGRLSTLRSVHYRRCSTVF